MLRRQDVGNCPLDTAGEQTSDPEGGSGEGTQIEAWRRKSIENKGIHTQVKENVVETKVMTER